jgi:hypothetical protein
VGGSALGSVDLERDLQNNKAGVICCAILRLSRRTVWQGMPGRNENEPTMTYRTCQNIVLIGSFLLLLDILFLPPLVEKWGAVDRVGRLPQLNTPNVAAATIVKVWVYKKTGLYFCPDSKLYGKVKPGVYMTQEKALGRGYRPAGQDPCR